MSGVWTARPEQLEGAEEALEILERYNLVYLMWEERTGKSITDVIIADRFKMEVECVLGVSKKKALEGWQETLSKFAHERPWKMVNYHAVDKVSGRFGLVVLDEAHAYISGYPKRSKIWHDLQERVYGLPIIYNSATSHAQGYHLLYNQLALSAWSPWKRFPTFIDWWKHYGKRDEDGRLPTTRISPTHIVPDYTKVREDAVWDSVKHLFTVRTRAGLGFEYEPEDVLHYVELSDRTKDVYNQIVTKKVVSFTHEESGRDYLLVCDTPMKLRTTLHMLEGGTLKVHDDYLTVGNTEKVDYALAKWGDVEDVVLMYQYVEERNKLARYFKRARLLQSTSYAEGVDLSAHRHLVIYSQDFSTARHTQRRARQANKERAERIDVNYLLVKKGVSEKAYVTVAKNKKNYVDTVFERID